MTKKTVYIMVGASGSGKSTWIKNNLTNALVCSADHFFYDDKGNYNWNPGLIGVAHETCQSKFKDALKNSEHTEIVVDNTNTRLKEIRTYVMTAQHAKADVVFVRFTVPPHICAARNAHSVPLEVVQGMYERCAALQIPSNWGREIWAL